MCNHNNTENDIKNSDTKRSIFTARVIANDSICSEHFRLLLDVGESFPATRAGQFVQVQAADDDSASEPVAHEWGGDDESPKLERPELTHNSALLRRPISLAGRHEIDGRVVLELIHRVVGKGTRWMADLPVGSEISIIGPLGNGFNLDVLPQKAFLVGGGVGLPPMMYLARVLAGLGVECEMYVGAASADLLPIKLSGQPDADGQPGLCCEHFDELGVKAVICTDDGSCGFKGFVTEPFGKKIESLDSSSDGLAAFTCGPEIMMQTVAKLCKKRKICCQVALERKMACGMGTCQSCVCKVHSDNEMGWKYKLVCTDGTVFDANDLIWE